MKLRYVLRSPAGDNAGEGSGPDNIGTGVMDAWGNGEGLGAGQQAPQQTPPPVQVTPPRRPQQTVISDNTPANQPQHQQGQPDSQQQPPQQTPPSTPGLSEADLQRIAAVAGGAAARAIQPQQSQQPPAAAPQMSEEEFAARYKTPRVDAAVMTAIHDPDPAKGAAALNNLLKQTYTSALLMANDLHQAELAKVRGEFAPHIESFQQQRQAAVKQQLETEFYTANPDLVNERELVQEVTDAFQAKVARGEIRFADKNQAFKAVADSVKKLLSRMGPTSAGQQTPNQDPVASVSTQRRMTSATSQARGGTGQQPNQQGSTMDRVMASWDS